MAAIVGTKALGTRSLPQVGDKISEAQHLTSVPGSASSCQICGAPATRPCDPELLQQTVSALLGVPVPTVEGALCAHCCNLAAQAYHLHTQLQELHDQLRHIHISTLYWQLDNRGTKGELC